MNVRQLIDLLSPCDKTLEVIIEDIEENRYSPEKVYTEYCEIWENDRITDKFYEVIRLD